FLSYAVGKTKSRSDLSFADINPGVLGCVAEAADEHLVGGRVVALAAAAIASRERIVFVAHAVVEGQFAVDLPLVTNIQTPRGHANCRGVDILQVFALCLG